MSKRASRIIILICAVSALLLFAFFLKDILIPFIKMEVNNDLDGAKELLRSKGVFGFLTVALVEALQMVVVFIPAEFIQISSGLSYPFYISLLLCDAGVCLGASIIFLLVRTFRIKNTAYEKRKKTIDRLAAKRGDKNIVFLMLLLFIMPLIPFGAICYYGSSTKIKYRNYILTVALGVIPSIVTSNLMGTAAKAFIMNSIPLWLLIIIIVFLSATLFTTLVIFINKFFLKQSDGTPDSPLYSLMQKLMNVLWKRHFKVKIINGIPEDIKPPFFVLSNHQCFGDFFITQKLFETDRSSYICNEYYMFKLPVFRKLSKKTGLIPKKLFTVDMATVAGMMRMAKKGYPITVFPEGRLSPDGKTNRIVEKSGAFYKKMGLDILFLNISGAYYAKPKWRKKYFRSEVRLDIKRIIHADELESMSADELNGIIESELEHDAKNDSVNTYRQKNKALGLEGLLYRCKDCGRLYTTEGKGNEFRCNSCGASYHFNDLYRFEEEIDGEPGSISAYYAKIRELEEADIDNVRLTAHVKTRIFDKKVKLRLKEEGDCELTPEGFTYRSGSEDFSVPISYLLALPFSCGLEFETYNDGELHYFYPVEYKNQVARWGLVADILRERYEKNEAKVAD